MRHWSRDMLLALVTAVLLVGCGDDAHENFASRATPSPTPVPLSSAMLLQPGTFSVGVTTMTFEDTSRPTMANGTYVGAASRTLPTEIWYPTDAAGAPSLDEQRDAPVATSGRPYPLVIYSHSFMGNRFGGEYLARQLASYGYVVASADFPLSNIEAPGGATAADVVNQPGDVTFLIDRLLELNSTADSAFAGSIDAHRIGLTGLSLGGLTTYLAAFHPTLRDPRVRAAAPIAGVGCYFGEKFFRETAMPLLILHGDIDEIVPYGENALPAFQEAQPPKYLVTIIGGAHTAFADGAEQIFEKTPNSDTVGCQSLKHVGTITIPGGAEAGIVDGNCPAACAAPRPFPRAIRPSRQHQLTILAVLPFFEAALKHSESARQFLEQSLVAQNGELTIQVQ